MDSAKAIYTYGYISPSNKDRPMPNNEMLSLEDARALVLSHVELMPTETVPILDAVGRVCAQEVTSDMDVAPFAHSAMDGFALRSAQIADASSDAPRELKVIAEIGAGSIFDGEIKDDECVRIMTGAEMPQSADSVVKYEIVGVVSGDGKPGSVVSFSAPTSVGSNVRQSGEEAKAGEVILKSGDVVGCAGAGYLASCGALEIETYMRPQVAIIATGSELVPPTEVPGPGHIRESNAYAIAACVQFSGAVPFIAPIVKDDYEALEKAVIEAADRYDFVITTGGAANGDFDFIKPVVENNGELFMTLVNMRPGKAQTFGTVKGTPVFGLPGNPAAAYCGFEMIVRSALRKMQGYTCFEHPRVLAKLTCDVKKKDPRRIYLRSTLMKSPDGDGYEVTPAKNQSSGLFGVIQRSNCMAVIPEGLESKKAHDEVECVLLDIPEEIVL